MARVYKHVTIYTGIRKIEDGYIRFSEKVEAVGPVADYVPVATDTVTSLPGTLVVPGFIDTHSHGGYGSDAMDADFAGLNAQVDHMLAEGTTSYFATTMTQAPEKIVAAVKNAAAVAKENKHLVGIHLEGPFVAAEFKGAQPEEYIQALDEEELTRYLKVGGGLVKVVTYAPEKENARAFEKTCLENGVIPSVGHSNAVATDLKDSLAPRVTHLYNAQHRMHHREPGVTGYALLEDGVSCELICDGFHVVPPMVKLAYRLKGPEKIQLVTDSMRAKGQGEGKSELGGQTVIVKDKQARLLSGNLAGSVLTMIDAFKNVIRFTGCSVEDAVLMSSVNQARQFNLAGKGGLEVGFDADFNCLTKDLDLVQTVSGGTVHDWAAEAKEPKLRS